MAGVFLSYDRSDGALAKRFAESLEGAGHEVWWDLHVRGGAQFAKVIEEALNQAEAVVVLWSTNSIESAWVRDEAAFARDRGKLVPVQIDSSEAPLGFRQFQSIDFRRWKGRSRSNEFKQLLSAIDGLGSSALPATTSQVTHEKVGGIKRFRPHIIGIFGLLALVAAVFAFSRMEGSGANVPTVAVVSVNPSSQSQKLARDLFIKLGLLQSADPDAFGIVSDNDKDDADFTFQVSGSKEGDNATATLAMLARDKSLLWSKDFQRPAEQIGDLQQQLGLMAARVLACASDGGGTKKTQLDQRTLRLYLSGCANLADLAWQDFRSLVPVFREVVKRAPKFEGGWAKLLTTEAYVIGWETLPPSSPEGRTLKKDIAIARRLDPSMPEAFWAEYMLVGQYDLVKAAEVLNRAVLANPDNPNIAELRVPILRRAGLLKEAVVAAKQAANHDPLDPSKMSDYVEALIYSGKKDTALQELEKAERLWPDTRTLVEARFRYYLRYGDPKEAMRIIHSGINPDYAGFEPFLSARMSPSQANIDAAIADAKSRVGQNPRATAWLVLALAQFGRTDEVFPIIEGPLGKSAIYLSDALFRPEFREVRQDPRFMRAAKNIGVLDYWQKSGKWPDFCFEPQLTYDCKKEAARLSS